MRWLLGLLLAGALLLLAGVAAVAWVGPTRAASYGIRAGGEALGYRELEVEVTSVGLDSLEVARLTVGPAPGLSVEGVTLSYRLGQLARGRVGRVQVGSATLHGVWSDAGIEFPALPVSEEGPWIAPPAFDRLDLARARVELGGPRGPVSLTVRGVELGALPGAWLEARAKASLMRPAGEIEADVDLVLDGNRVNGTARLRAKDGSLDLRADFGAPGQPPGRFPDVAGPEDLELAGRIDVSAQEADLSPLAPALTAHGSVELRLRAGRLRVRSEGLDLAAFGLDLAGLELDVDLDGLSPPAAPGGQRLAVETARLGMELGGGALRFGLRRDGVVEIESLEWSLHGGRLTTVARLDPGSDTNELVLGVGDVDLERLVAALGREDLRMSGRISGELPLRIEGDRIFAEGGRLTAGEDGGVIRYQRTGAGAAPPEKGSVQGVDLVVDALANFHYRTLQVAVDGELTGEMQLALRLEGSNPDVYDGYPFQLNLNLEGPLADVVSGGNTGFRIQDAIEERFQERGEKR